VEDHVHIAELVAAQGLDFMTKIQSSVEKILSDIKVDKIIGIFPNVISKFSSCFEKKTSSLRLSSILSPLGDFPSEIDIPFCLAENVIPDLSSLIKVDAITKMMSVLKSLASRAPAYIQILRRKIDSFLTASPAGFIEDSSACSHDTQIKFNSAINFFKLFKSFLMNILNYVSTVLEVALALVDLFATPIDAKFHTVIFVDVGITKPEFMAEIVSSILKIKDPIGQSFDVIIDLSVWIQDLTCESVQINAANQLTQMVTDYLNHENQTITHS